MPDLNNGPLERLRRRLYTQGANKAYVPQVRSDRTHSGAPMAWEHPAPPPPRKPGLSGATIFLIAATAFFVIAGIVAVAIVLLGTRAVSSDHINITVGGPTAIASGDTVSLLVTVENHNPVPINGANLTLVFPDGTRSADDPTQTLPRYSDSLGDIPAGGKVERTARAVFFGSEGATVDIPMTLEYTTNKSNSTFNAKKDYTFTVSTSPITININTLSQSASGQPLSLNVVVRNNAATPLDNVAVVGAYPFGFIPSTATPQPSLGNVFSLGTFKPSEEKTIQIAGTLSGSAGDQRDFRFTVGTIKPGATSLDVSYTSKEALVTLTKPFLAVALALNHETSDVMIVNAGSTISGLLSWVNNLSSTIYDGQVLVKFSGNALDPSSVSTDNGFYRSSDNSILFDKTTSAELAALQAGDTGAGSFSFAAKSGSAARGLQHPAITLTVSIAGKRVGESNVPETVTSTITRTINIATNLALTAHAARTSGALSANTPTGYTIALSATNSVNSVGGATATMTLPSYVTFVRGSDSSVSYNDSNRQVIWNAGDINGGGSDQASFQITMTPSTSQSGTSPALITGLGISGTDRFTQTQVSSTVSDITTDTNVQ